MYGDRSVVDVGDAGCGVVPVGDLVHVARRWDTGAEVEAAVDACSHSHRTARRWNERLILAPSRMLGNAAGAVSAVSQSMAKCCAPPRK